MNYCKNLFKTEDGSMSFRIEKLNETYHSKNGAITESQFVYIQRGYSYWNEINKKGDCKIFEMGYGTGLNAYLSYLESQKHNNRTYYTSLELFPLSVKEIACLNYDKFFKTQQEILTFESFSKIEWEIGQDLSENFNLLIKKLDFKKLEEIKKYDIIFYDAFGYHAQPELWSMKYIQKCYDMLFSGGIWISYCAKGSVRRALEKSGFEVERLPGPPGKREMLRALKV